MSKNHTTESDILPINTDFPINNKYKSINFNSRIRQIIIPIPALKKSQILYAFYI
jgi:hypothetical protein